MQSLSKSTFHGEQLTPVISRSRQFINNQFTIFDRDDNNLANTAMPFAQHFGIGETDDWTCQIEMQDGGYGFHWIWININNLLTEKKVQKKCNTLC